MPIPKLKYEISPDKLAKFTNDYAASFFEVCIMIEKVSAVEYGPFYSAIREDFRKVFESGMSLDTVSTTRMYEAYTDFDKSIKDFFINLDLSGIGAVEMLNMPVLTAEQCREKFDRLWTLESL